MKTDLQLFYNPVFYKDKVTCLYMDNRIFDLYSTIKQTDFTTLSLSEYGLTYLQKHIDSLQYLFQMYAHITYHLKQESQKPFQEITLIDHGGGIGLLSLFCHTLGMKVIYNDVYHTIVKDAKNIAEILEVNYKAYIHGTIEDVIRFTTNNNYLVDAIVSSEVIEHIYDIDTFFKHLKDIPSKQLCFVFSTSANPLNPIRKQKLMHMQRDAERKDSQYTFGHKEKDSLQSFLSIREQIIREHYNELPQKTIQNLAKKTRGLREDAIIQAVTHFIKTGTYPKEPEHRSNTCDPYTGNWVERLFNPYKLQQQLQKEGFQANVINGYYGYNQKESPSKRTFKKIANQLIFKLKSKGIYLTHYWMLVGKK